MMIALAALAWALGSGIAPPAGSIWVAPEPAPAGVAEPEESTLLLAAQAAGGLAGASALEILFQGRRGGYGIFLGGEGASGPRAPLRAGAIGGAELPLAGGILHGELRVRPEQSGSSRGAAALGFSSEDASGPVDLTLRASRVLATPAAGAHAPLARLTSLGAEFSADQALGAGWSAGIRGSAALHRLEWSSKPAKRAWEEFSALVLEWPGRWQIGGSVRSSRGPFTAALSSALAAPAAAGTLSASCGLRLEAAVGRVLVGLSIAAVRAWPTGLFLGEGELAMSFRLGGGP